MNRCCIKRSEAIEMYRTFEPPHGPHPEGSYDNKAFSGSIGDSSNISTKDDIESEEDQEDIKEDSRFHRTLDRVKSNYRKFKENNSKTIRIIFMCTLAVLYHVYFAYALYLNWNKTDSYCHGVKFLLLLTIFAYVCILLNNYWINLYLIEPFYTECYLKLVNYLDEILTSRNKKIIQICVYLLIIGFIVTFVIIDSRDDRRRLISAGGIVILLILGLLFSRHPTKVNVRPVICGMLIQFIFGLMILRWSVGRSVFECLGNKVKTFLEFTDAGSSFVFNYLVSGKLNSDHGNPIPDQTKIFAFKVLPVIIFFSFFTSILYHYGIMQAVVRRIGRLLNVLVGTTAAESMNAAANIFIGQTEAPLLIAPFINDLTKSELHSVMTGGFATIAGTVLAAFINFGIDASHLLSASVMSAPAALAYSKLFYPETEKTKTSAEEINMDKGDSKNVLEAAAKGASDAIVLVANITANLIAFLAFIKYLDVLLSYFGGLVDYPKFSFDWILSKVFMPLAYIMGVEWQDCEKVARLIGLKTIVNEFVAYSELGIMMQGNQLSARSATIATYALCGFSNISSIGIQLGGLGAIAPNRKSDLAEIAVRAMIAGCAACFLTACIAGTLITEHGLPTQTIPQPLNVTSATNLVRLI